MKLNELPKKLREQVEAQLSRDAANTASNVEPNTRDEPLGEKEAPRFDTPCRVHFHSIRKRLADCDGISGKAALDGLVHENIFRDDSTQYVENVSHSQEKAAKGQSEKTIITITEI